MCSQAPRILAAQSSCAKFTPGRCPRATRRRTSPSASSRASTDDAPSNRACTGADPAGASSKLLDRLRGVPRIGRTRRLVVVRVVRVVCVVRVVRLAPRRRRRPRRARGDGGASAPRRRRLRLVVGGVQRVVRQVALVELGRRRRRRDARPRAVTRRGRSWRPRCGFRPGAENPTRRRRAACRTHVPVALEAPTELRAAQPFTMALAAQPIVSSGEHLQAMSLRTILRHGDGYRGRRAD